MPIDHDHAEMVLQKLLSDRPASVIKLALRARSVVHKTAKKSGQECCELVYCSYAVSDVFSFSGKLGQAFIHIATYAGHVNLGFNNGVSLPDPETLLEGTGKAIRHVKLSSVSNLNTAPVKALIQAAVAQGVAAAAAKGGAIESTFVYKEKSK